MSGLKQMTSLMSGRNKVEKIGLMAKSIKFLNIILLETVFDLAFWAAWIKSRLYNL